MYNRRFFEEELKRLDTARNLPITLIMADVNGLKLTNDAFGHHMGDQLLKKAAEVIKKECRSDDIIARIDGDEFILLLPRTEGEEAERIVERIKSAMTDVKINLISLSVSFGFDTKAHQEKRISEVLKNAEDNMYRMKLYEGPVMRSRMIMAIVQALYDKSDREREHSLRVGSLCGRIGKALGMSERDCEGLQKAGILHDIGKIAIDEKILNKKGNLSITEWTEVKRHSEVGYRILNSLHDMTEMAHHILCHHERWDGSGYPKGLKGDQIEIEARIIAIADAYEAMTSDKPYKKAMKHEEAVKYLSENAGKEYDPLICKVFIEEVVCVETRVSN
jgi:diguanylate cyclase (GGDEF)-like protein